MVEINQYNLALEKVISNALEYQFINEFIHCEFKLLEKNLYKGIVRIKSGLISFLVRFNTNITEMEFQFQRLSKIKNSEYLQENAVVIKKVNIEDMINKRNKTNLYQKDLQRLLSFILLTDGRKFYA